MKKFKGFFFVTLVAGLFLVTCKTTDTQPPVSPESVYQIDKFIQAPSAAVVTAHPEASRIGLDILRQGGNAVDAAIAVQFALAVCYPVAGNIGGGGFMVYRNAQGHAARSQAPGHL